MTFYYSVIIAIVAIDKSVASVLSSISMWSIKGIGSELGTSLNQQSCIQ